MLFLQIDWWGGNLFIKEQPEGKKFKQQCKLTGPIPKVPSESCENRVMEFWIQKGI